MKKNNRVIKNRKLIQAWILKAKDDFNFAKDTLKETNYYDHVCFLSQQAVEKYLKALIIIFQGELKKEQKTHNLIYLAKILKKYDFDLLSKYSKKLRMLAEAYIPARYPADRYVKFSKKDAEECFMITEELIDFIENKIDLSLYLMVTSLKEDLKGQKPSAENKKGRSAE